MAKVSKITQSLNSGELSPLMRSRSDQQKYASGCKTMENAIPLIYGGAQKRPGLEYISAAASNSDKSKLVSFEHSVDDTYILEFGNQTIRMFKSGSAITTSVGNEDLSALDNIIAHWKCNETEGTTALDDDGNTHDGTITVDASTVTAIGKAGTAFNLDNQYNVTVPDSNDFSFDDSGSNPFSIAMWANVTDKGSMQTLLSKWDETTGAEAREWRFSVNSDQKLQMHMSDDSISISGAVSHWKLNDNAASTVVVDSELLQDGVASANTDTFNDAGVVNGALDFGGTQKATIADNAAYSFTNDSTDSAFSISAWIFVTNTGSSQRIISKWAGSSREWLFYIDSSERLQLLLWDEATDGSITTVSNSAVPTGWHYVTATYSGSDTAAGINLYIDNVLATSTDATNGTYNSMLGTATDVIIGTDGDGTAYFQDKIDNIILFNKVLSTSEISSLYNSGNGTETLSSTFPNVISDDSLSVGWHFLAMTYDNADVSWSGATAANFIKLYVDGALVNSTATNEANYVAMENTAAIVRIGATESAAGVAENYWNDRVDNVFMTSDELTANEIAALYTTASYSVASPYLTADLFSLKFEHSADVMFITHPSYEPRKLSRTADDEWTLVALDVNTGPFRDQNTDIAKTITPSGTTGTVTLTAVGHEPFVSGTTAGHEPSGSLSTSKSLTGALFKLVQANPNDSVDAVLANTNDMTSELTINKGISWDFTTTGTWTGTVKVQKEYNNSGIWETVKTVVSAANKNVITTGTEETDDAQYRVTMTDGSSTSADVQLSVRDASHIGIVEITSVQSSTVATGVVKTTLADVNATHRWSEGSFSNRRGWPIDVVISAEERLTFAGSVSEPLTVWGSVIGDFTNFKEGADDDDAIQFTLVGSGKQNRIRWMIAKNSLVLGTVGGEHLLGASNDEEALTPTNVKAKLQTTYGSEDVGAKVVNQAVLFVQRGGKKIREFLYNFEADAHKADDLTVFAEHVTGDGIVDIAFQRTPDPMLWCVRTDGEIAVLSYERDQNVFSWSRLFTSTKDGTADRVKSVMESIAVIYGGTRTEDEVWVSILRQVNGSPSRTIERFTARDLPASASDYKFLDSYVTATPVGTTVSGLTHLIGEDLQVLGDGVAQTETTAEDFVVNGSGEITVPSGLTTVQAGLGYTTTIVPMDLDIEGTGLATTKRINRCIINFYETIGGTIGPDSTHQEDIPTGTSLFTSHKEISIPGGYSRDTDITFIHNEPTPATVLSLTYDLGASRD